MNRCSHAWVVLFLESSSHFTFNVLIEVTTVTLKSAEFIRDLSARVIIVSRVSLPPFSAGILVGRPVTKNSWRHQNMRGCLRELSPKR